jgi:hypothetical protein
MCNLVLAYNSKIYETKKEGERRKRKKRIKKK